jgi:LysW-gamma-L-lysine carboxypeptidase
MQERAVRLLTDLLGVYSPSGKEATISKLLFKEMQALGFRARTDLIGNVIGEIGKGEPTILLCGHMDTVAGKIPVRLKKDKLYGRGAVDAKGPLAAMVIAATEVAKENPNVRVIVAGVVEEEGTSRGIKQLIAEGISADYVIFGEPSRVETITIGYKGSLSLKLTCKTQTGHSSAPWLYENAIEKAFELWQQIKNSYPPVEKQRSPYNAVTSSLIRIAGGKTGSTVPSECEMHIDIRVPPGTTSAKIYGDLNDVVKRFQEANPKVSVKLFMEDSNEPFEASKTSLLVRALSFSIRKVRNKQATLLRKTGTGDMNTLGRAISVPIVTYGPGDSHLDHTKNEHIEIKDYLDGIRVYKETILKLGELHLKTGNK